MSKRKFFYFSIGFLYLLFIQGILRAQTPTPETNPPDNEAVSRDSSVSEPEALIKAENLIHYGDLIDVDVVGSTEYDWRGKLSPEGFLSGVDFTDEPVYGLCKSEEEVALALSKGIGKFLTNPHIIVKIIDRSGRPVSQVFGAVKTPQRFQIRRPVTLNELIVLSGGVTEKANGDIQILRPPNLSCELRKRTDKEGNKSETQTTEKFIPTKQERESKYINIKISDLLKGKSGANPLILTGDVVTILESEPIYVIGGVINPKQINTNSQLTLLRALDSAGGFTKDADPKKIVIFRRGKNKVESIDIDFEKIKSSAENDFVLQALDIILVPQRGRERSRFPPVIKFGENNAENNLQPPLKIID